MDSNKTAPESVREHRFSQGPRHETAVGGVVTENDSTQYQAPRIAWTCETCSFPIADGAGCLGIPFRNLSARVDLRWRAQHNHCIDPEHDVYGIPVSDLRDANGVIRWTAHLMSKSWFTDSTWRGVLMHVGGSKGVPA